MSTTYGARRAARAVKRSTISSTSSASTAGGLDLSVLGDGAGLDVGGERPGVEHVAGPQADPAGLVGVGRSDALQRRADLVVAAHRLGDGVVRLVPREDEVGPAGHLQAGARHAAGLERVDLGEQRRQVDDDAVADHRHDVVVEDAARDQLQGVAVAADDDGVAGVVAALVAHDVGVLLGQQVDDLGLALVTPLGADDDGDGHGTLPERVDGTYTERTGPRSECVVPSECLLRGRSAADTPSAANTRIGADRAAAAGYRRRAMDSVLRLMRWAAMDEPARAALCARGLADIFDPAAAALDRRADRGRARARRRRGERRPRPLRRHRDRPRPACG